ncbi:MAG TPA: PaaI family thioesterase [Jatrophihabitans sp.]|uniref:PaaI family thioesterase n=1 Tax=Jatrophihabitans sp. TaxID=1932789 RepID=UPI002DFA3D8C|nr:PaaI family thioesterase [Jatrophihabitans sp.]
MSPWPDGDIDWYRQHDSPRGGAEYAELHHAQRLLQDRLAGAALPPEVSKDVTERLLELADELAAHQVAEVDRFDSWRPDLPGRGHPLLPPFVIDAETGTSLSGRVTFTRFHLGGNGAVHGGTQPLLFDDLLGRVANRHQSGIARTAYLTVNFRKVTPVDVELHFDATLDSLEGRKRFASGRLTDATGAVLAEAEGLFIRLQAGQQ